MPARIRRWSWIILALMLSVAFAHFCVRILPADGPSLPAPTAVAAGPLLIPVEGVPAAALTDSFTQARGAGTRSHAAIDIKAARGRAVRAAASGRIEKIFWSKDGGRTLYARTDDGRQIHYYAHLDSYAPGLREGGRVIRGAKIGTVGSTGNADPAGPHLHFAVHVMAPGEPWHGGRAINPYPLLARAR
ncbi:M23 family metallopeptidase [Sphingobium sp. AN641]|uniref:M23 family metallopeptidase n=1 Tax=Sphingobium sp. AN641 TaxID=3133443 RepID=UPI0030C2AA97